MHVCVLRNRVDCACTHQRAQSGLIGWLAGSSASLVLSDWTSARLSLRARRAGSLTSQTTAQPLVYGHTTRKAPVPVRSPKLNRVGPGQYLVGRPPWKARCCRFFASFLSVITTIGLSHCFIQLTRSQPSDSLISTRFVVRLLLRTNAVR